MVRTAALALVLLASSASAQDIHGHLDQWDEHQAEFEERGLTRDLWLMSVVVYEGMWVSGYCRDFMPAESAWSIPENAPPDLRRGGQQQYDAGAAEALTNPPTASHCAEAMQSMVKESQFILKQTSLHDGQRSSH